MRAHIIDNNDAQLKLESILAKINMFRALIVISIFALAISCFNINWTAEEGNYKLHFYAIGAFIIAILSISRYHSSSITYAQNFFSVLLLYVNKNEIPPGTPSKAKGLFS